MTSPGSCLSWFRKVNVTWLLLCVAALSARFQLEVHAVQIPASELSLLKDIFLALNGSEGFALGDLPGDYDPLESWVAANDCSEWVGVTCDSAGHVTSIILSSDPFTLLNGTTKEPTIDATSLGGTLSPSLGSLTMLETLVIANQAVTGAIPPTLGNLTKLKTLSIGDNILYGKIPAALGALANLEYLDISANTVGDGDSLLNAINGSIPDSFGNLVNLQFLDLSQTNLSGIPPPSLKNLSKLIHLDLHDNKFTGQVSAFLPAGSNISHLDLSSNKFNGGIDFIADSIHLKYLSLGENLYSGSIPPSLGNLTNLEFFSSNGNKYTGSLPDSFERLSKLKELNLAKNSLSGPLPDSLKKLTALEKLDLGSNAFNGTIIDHFKDYKNLTELGLDNNNFVGEIPVWLTKYSRLTFLDLSFCNLNGSIPADIGSLAALDTLGLSGNRLTGEIPRSIGNLKKLVQLALDGNQLSGSIPGAVQGLSSLDALYLNNNNLSGPLPPGLGRMTALTSLLLSENKLTGDLTPLLDLADTLFELDASNNSLSGQIPPALGNFGELAFLTLNYNDFSGSLPKKLGNLSSLVSLQVRGCNLVGEIPAEIGYLEGLSTLDLSHNSFSGPLPSTFFTNFTAADQISISSNSLHGKIPALKSMTKLNNLDLSNNQFSGGMSQVFPPLLVSLNLSTNHLESNLTFLNGLKKLDVVNLASNLFYGDVPPIKAAVVLLSNNNLTGIAKMNNTQNATLQLSGNPLCFGAGFASQEDCQSGEVVEPFNEQPPCAIKCESNNAANPYLLSVNNTCECAGLVSMVLKLSQSPYLVFTYAALAKLKKAFSQGSVPFDERQVFVQEATAEQDGTLLVQLQLFSHGVDPPSVVTVTKFLQSWNRGNPKGYDIDGLGTIKFSSVGFVKWVRPKDPESGATGSIDKDKKLKAWVLTLAIVCPVLLLILIVLVAALLIISRRSAEKKKSDFLMKLEEHFVRPIRLADIVVATNNFSKENELGHGGYGYVYKGVTAEGKVWAVKKAISVTLKSLEDFENEVSAISKMAHRNIVRLLGYCDENNEQIFVYEFMAGGTLKEKLRNKAAPDVNPLSFAERVGIAAGVAEGLSYLHNFATPAIIHRDIKSDNILLGENLEAKIADFGLLRDLNAAKESGNRGLAGSPGYIDPEYCTTFEVTAKSDVYSFGVVLLELITGLGPLIKDDSVVDGDESNITALANWAQRQPGQLDTLVDPRLQNDYNQEAMSMLAKLATNCTERSAMYRPAMTEVTTRLTEIKNKIEGVADMTRGGGSLSFGDTSSRAAPIPPSVYSGTSSVSQSYYLAPVSEAYEGR